MNSDTEDSKFECASSSLPSRGVLLQRQEDSQQKCHTKTRSSISIGGLFTSVWFRTFFQKCTTEVLFSATLLFADEACWREGNYNIHDANAWTIAKPHATLSRAEQIRFSVNVWVGNVGDNLIGPYLLTFCLTSNNYFSSCCHNFCMTNRFLHRCDLQCGSSTMGSPIYLSLIVGNHLESYSANGWFGLSDPVHWPARSLDLWGHNDYFVQKHIKTLL